MSTFSTSLGGAMLAAAAFTYAAELPFGFAAPEMTLADYNTRELRSADLNQDGLTDLVLLNSDRGRIDIFIHTDGSTPRTTPTLHRDRWEPLLSHPRFQRESLIPDHPAQSLASGDFNADGIDDFAITDDQNELHIYHGPLQADWSPSTHLKVEAVQNAPGSLRWDAGEQTLVLLGREAIQEVRWNAKDKAYTVETVGAPPSGESPKGLFFADVDGNGSSDVLYQLGGSRFNLAVHPRFENGLGSLTLPPVDPPAKNFTPVAGNHSALLAMHQRSPTLLEFDFAADAGAESPDLQFINLADQTLQQTLWTDLDDDGHEDAILLPKNRPELTVLMAGENRRFDPPASYPLPVKPAWIIQGRFLERQKQAVFLVHDPDTGYLGLTRFEDGRITIPVSIENTDTILTATACQLPNEKTEGLAGVIRTEDRKYLFRVWKLITGEDGAPALEQLQELELPEVKRDMSALLSVTQDSGPKRFLFAPTPLGDAFFLVPDAEGTYAYLQPAEGFSANLLERTSVGDHQQLPADIAATRWAHFNDESVQFLRLEADGTVQVVDQINLQNQGRAAAILPMQNDGGELALLDRSNNRLEIHTRQENGRYAFDRDIALPSLQTSEVQLTLPSKKEALLRIQGRNQIALLSTRTPDTQVRSRMLFEADLPEVQPGMILTGDFNGDEVQDIIWIDQTSRYTLEVLTPKAEGWRSAMHFQLFESAPGAAGRRGGSLAPREALVQDMNKDGLDDLVLLMHDRLLLYLQDPVPGSE